MAGSPELSSGATNASIVPSRDKAKWLTSAGTGMANCWRSAAAGRLASHHDTAATTAISNKITAQRNHEIWLAAGAIRGAVVLSVPDSADNANDKSFADWKRCSEFFSRQRRTIRSSAGEIGCDAATGSAGSSLRTAVIVSAGVSRRNAR